MSNENQNSISWEAWEFKHYPKNPGWYIVLLCLSILAMGFFIVVQSDVFAAVIIAILTVLIIIFAKQKPNRVNIELNTKGVNFGGLFYPYKQLKHFWVVHNERHQTVNFHTTALINSILILELENEDPDEIRNFLLKHLPEHSETDETPIQQAMHRFKF